MPMAFWAAALSYHFMMHLAYLRTEKRLRKLMKWLHLFAWGPFAVTIIIALVLDIFGSAGYWCWVVPEAVYMRGFVFSFIWICVASSVIFTAFMIIRIKRVQKTLSEEGHRNQMAGTNFFLWQAVLYIAIFLFSFMWPTLNRLYSYATGEQSLTLDILHAIFGPLWGFLNVSAHLAPKIYMRKVSFWEGFSYTENQKQRNRLADSKNHLFSSTAVDLDRQAQQPEGYVYMAGADGVSRFVSIPELASVARRRPGVRPEISFTESSVEDLSQMGSVRENSKHNDGKGALSPELSFNDPQDVDGETSEKSFKTIVEKAKHKLGLTRDNSKIRSEGRNRASSRKDSALEHDTSVASNRHIRDISAFLGEHSLSDASSENAAPEVADTLSRGEVYETLPGISFVNDGVTNMDDQGLCVSANSLNLDGASGPEFVHFRSANSRDAVEEPHGGGEMIDLDTILNNIETMGTHKRKSILGKIGRSHSRSPSPAVTPRTLSPGSSFNSAHDSPKPERSCGRSGRKAERPRSASRGLVRDAWASRNNALDVNEMETRTHSDINRMVSAPFALTKKLLRSLSDGKGDSDDQGARRSPKAASRNEQGRKKSKNETGKSAERRATGKSSEGTNLATTRIESAQSRRKGKGESLSESSATQSHSHAPSNTLCGVQSTPLANTQSYPPRNNNTITFTDTKTRSQTTWTNKAAKKNVSARLSPSSSNSDPRRVKISKKIYKGKQSTERNLPGTDLNYFDTGNHSSSASSDGGAQKGEDTTGDNRDFNRPHLRERVRHTQSAVVRGHDALSSTHMGAKHTQSMVARGDVSGSYNSLMKVEREGTSEKVLLHGYEHSEHATQECSRQPENSNTDSTRNEGGSLLSGTDTRTTTDIDKEANSSNTIHGHLRSGTDRHEYIKGAPNITLSSESRDAVSITSEHAISETTPNICPQFEECSDDDAEGQNG